MKNYLLAEDVGKKQDPYALGLFELNPVILPADPLKNIGPRKIIFLDWLYAEKGTGVDYVEHADHLVRITEHVNLIDNYDFVMDDTGVGEAVADIYAAKGLNPVRVVFTSGKGSKAVYLNDADRFNNDHKTFNNLKAVKQFNVGKEELVTCTQLVLQQNRLRISPKLRYQDEIKKQLQHFTGTINEKTKHVSYNNDSNSVHDDWVTMLMQACWWLVSNTREVDGIQEGRAKGYDGNDNDVINYNIFDIKKRKR